MSPQASTEGEDIVLTDVMFGDVWLCSGQVFIAFKIYSYSWTLYDDTLNCPQSNMEQSMLNIMNATEEVSLAAEADMSHTFLDRRFRELHLNPLHGGEECGD